MPNKQHTSAKYARANEDIEDSKLADVHSENNDSDFNFISNDFDEKID